MVADTNIYISAILFGGRPAEIRQLARDGEIELLISEHILAEIADVLKIEFGWSDRQIAAVLDELREISVLITPAKTLSIIKECVEDNRILECAVEGSAEYIVSGDKRHILPLGRYKDITILSASEFINTIHEDNQL
ncbi:MAG: putative toxin-antitoxin system toxin component, PIN family [bacterium]|nr:putative toxin-antitoxin system toxin component, PIN family [bacterium]